MFRVSVLVAFSMFIGFMGGNFLSEATLGVGLLCLAAILAIYARIAQAWGWGNANARVFNSAEEVRVADMRRILYMLDKIHESALDPETMRRIEARLDCLIEIQANAHQISVERS